MSCAQSGCREDDLANWAIGHVQVSACTPHGLALASDPEILRANEERIRKQRQLEILVEALKGPAANTDRALAKLEELLEVEGRLRVLVYRRLTAPSTRPC
ncbi:MAG: hypothetical protein V4537_14350 [Pseudomonadota bacterium]